ncbi:MAG: NADH-quinone oxidoreductase subunit N [Akkermansia sp.]
MTQQFVSAPYTWAQFSPSFALVGLAMLLLMADAFLPKFPRRGYALIAGIGALMAACFQFSGEFANPFGLIACVATGVSLLIAFDYTKVTCDSVTGGSNDDGTGEFYALPLVAAAGICVLSQAHDLIMLFVGLEVLTLTSYVLAGYYRRNQGSVEAGVKYIILGGVSTAILCFGTAWYFGMTGSFVLAPFVIAETFTAASSPILSVGLMMSFALMLVGIAFKVGLAPMQMWIPDVYQGAPTPVSAFLAVASKAAGLAALYALLYPMLSLSAIFPAQLELLVLTISIIAAVTLIIGNLGAIKQQNAKRLLGYSSIGQAGFILIFFLNPESDIFASVYAYMLAYALATLASFAAIALVRSQRGSEQIEVFRGLGKTNPRFAFAITICMASLAGVPLTFGFLVKLNSFLSIVDASVVGGQVNYLIYLLPIMLITASAGFYYYFKILRAMYWEKPAAQDKPICVPLVSGLILTICSLILLYRGVLALLVDWKL